MVFPEIVYPPPEPILIPLCVLAVVYNLVAVWNNLLLVIDQVEFPVEARAIPFVALIGL